MTLCSLPFALLLEVVRRRRDMIAATPEKSLNAPEFAQSRRGLLALTILNIIIYAAAIIPMAVLSRSIVHWRKKDFYFVTFCTVEFQTLKAAIGFLTILNLYDKCQ